MKKKTGFTLAEVLITLAIIGIIAAIVLPALMTSFTYRAIGVRLSKFLSSTENAARAYAVSNDNFRINDRDGATQVYVNLSQFVNDAFIIEDNDTPANQQQGAVIFGPNWQPADTPNAYAVTANAIQDDAVGAEIGVANPNMATLRDGTSVRFIPIDVQARTFQQIWTPTDAGIAAAGGLVRVANQAQIGNPVMAMIFRPNVNGTPNNVRQEYAFFLTELGYVFPAPDDNCLWEIANNGYAARTTMFAQGARCGSPQVVAIP